MNITKRTQYYPLAAGAAAAANVAANVVLIPRFGILGPAWSNVISYAVLAGVAFVFSQRFYPIRYEYGRIARVVAAGVAAWIVAAVLLVPQFASPSSASSPRGTVVVARLPGGPRAPPASSAAQELERLARLVRPAPRGPRAGRRSP